MRFFRHKSKEQAQQKDQDMSPHKEEEGGCVFGRETRSIALSIRAVAIGVYTSAGLLLVVVGAVLALYLEGLKERLFDRVHSVEAASATVFHPAEGDFRALQAADAKMQDKFLEISSKLSSQEVLLRVQTQNLENVDRKLDSLLARSGGLLPRTSSTP